MVLSRLSSFCTSVSINEANGVLSLRCPCCAAASLFDDLPLESTATPTGGGGGREPLLGKRKSVEEIERETPAKLPKTYGGWSCHLLRVN